MAFDLGNLLQQFAERPTATDPDGVSQAFSHVVGNTTPATIAQGLASAFLSDDTPPFGQLVSQLFGRSDPQLQTGLLNQLLDHVSPAMLTALAGSVGELFTENGHAKLTPEQVAGITPPQVAEIAATAQQHNPGVIERVASFFADHPQLVNSLDSASLKVALGKMAQVH